MGQYPDRAYAAKKPVEPVETATKIKVCFEHEEVTEYLKKLKQLQDTAKRKGLSRG